MANYDPNDPRRTDATDPHRPSTSERHVEPVARRASPLPLIIGILLALAIAYCLVRIVPAFGPAVAAPFTTCAPTTTAAAGPAAAAPAWPASTMPTCMACARKNTLRSTART